MDGPWRWGSRFAGNILPPAPIRSDPIHYRITAACRVMHKQKQIVCGWLRYKIPKTSDKIDDIIGRKLHFHKNFLRPFEKEARGKEGFKLFRHLQIKSATRWKLYLTIQVLFTVFHSLHSNLSGVFTLHKRHLNSRNVFLKVVCPLPQKNALLVYTLPTELINFATA